MNLHTVKKKFRQEVLVDNRGQRNSNIVVIRKFILLCAKAAAGLVLSIFLGPISLIYPIEIWLMKLGPDKVSHFIDGIETHLRRDHLNQKRNSIKVVVWPQKFPNDALAKLYRRVVYIIGPRQKLVAKVLPFVIWKVKICNHSVNSNSVANQIVKNHLRQSVSFSIDELQEGFQLSQQILNDKYKEFITIGFASSLYRSEQDQKFHLRDDLNSAIPDPLNFVKVIEMLKHDRIRAVRQGLYLEEISELSSAGLFVTNYGKFASGFPDVWLGAKCKFLLSACTGNWWFGLPFNKPAVITDAYTPIGISGLKSNLIIFQLPWSLKEEKFENFAWMSSNPRWCYSSEKLGVEYVNIKNSPDQIVDVVYEQVARLNGSWVETDEDKELQQRFQRLVWGKDADPAYLPRVGAKFLREHQHLLPD